MRITSDCAEQLEKMISFDEKLGRIMAAYIDQFGIDEKIFAAIIANADCFHTQTISIDEWLWLCTEDDAGWAELMAELIQEKAKGGELSAYIHIAFEARKRCTAARTKQLLLQAKDYREAAALVAGACNGEETDTEEPVSSEEADTEEPVSSEEADTEEPVSSEGADTEEPVSSEEADTEEPVSSEEADTEEPVSSEKTGTEEQTPDKKTRTEGQVSGEEDTNIIERIAEQLRGTDDCLNWSPAAPQEMDDVLEKMQQVLRYARADATQISNMKHLIFYQKNMLEHKNSIIVQMETRISELENALRQAKERIETFRQMNSVLEQRLEGLLEK